MKWNSKAAEKSAGRALVSHTGQILDRPVSFKFALDPNQAQARELFSYAGARRYAWNYHVARVKANLETRAAELDAGKSRDQLTPVLSWSAQSLINHFNAWKRGEAEDSIVNDDGSRGLSWRDQVAADVFECASVDVARALAAFSKSIKGERSGPRVGFPRFQSKRRDTPTFRLRSRSSPGKTAPIRFEGNKVIRVPRLGQLRIHGSAKKVRRMVEAGRFHIYSATFTFRRGRWWVSVNGVAAQFHHQRRATTHRHQTPVGVDLGVKSLAVVADAEGNLIKQREGVKALETALVQLKRANQRLARTKPGSVGRRKARRRLNQIHGRIAAIREHEAHTFSHWLVTNHATVTVEDLHVAGMTRLRSLARAVSDQGMGNLLKHIEYKAAWYGTHLQVADRWYPSSKTCSGCGQVKETLELSERDYVCGACGLVVDRDLNAAVNLARWGLREEAAIQVESRPLQVAA